MNPAYLLAGGVLSSDSESIVAYES